MSLLRDTFYLLPRLPRLLSEALFLLRQQKSNPGVSPPLLANRQRDQIADAYQQEANWERDHK